MPVVDRSNCEFGSQFYTRIPDRRAKARTVYVLGDGQQFLTFDEAVAVAEIVFEKTGNILSVEKREPTRVVSVKRNGATKTWKRDTERFRIPYKYGMYDYGYIDNDNAHLFFTEESEA